MPDFQGALLFDSAINLEGLTRGAANAKNILDRLGSDATKTFQNDIARGLANAVRPENFAGDVNKSKALLRSIGVETSKVFETTLGRRQARNLLQPFIDEATTFSGRLKTAFTGSFDIKNLALGAAGGFGLVTIAENLLQLGKASVRFASDFETSLVKIKTIADRGTNIQQIGENLKNLSATIPQDLLTLSEGYFNIIGSGITKSADALKVLDVAARAATAGFTDTKFAADAIVFSINAFGRSANDAEEIANTLFKTVDVGKIEFKDLASNIGEVANPAAIAGVSLKELGQIIAATTLAGVPVSEAFTGIKNILQSIVAPTEGARKAAQAFGLDFSKAGIQAAGGLENFLQKVRQATGGDTKKLDQLFPEARALRIAQIATNTMADTYVRLGSEFDKITAKSGEMQRAFEDVQSSSESQMSILANNIKLFSLEAGKGFLDVFVPALKVTNKVLGESSAEIRNYMGNFLALVKATSNPTAAALISLFGVGKSQKPSIPITTSTPATFGINTSAKAAEEAAKIKKIQEETTARLKEIVKLGGENADAAREELKKREEIAEVIKRTTNELQLLRANSMVERELIAIEQKFDSLREKAHGNIAALKLLAQQEQLEIDKTVKKISSAQKLFELAGGNEKIKNQAEAIRKKYNLDENYNPKLITELPETETAKKLKLVAMALDATAKEADEAQTKLLELTDDLAILGIAFSKALGDDFGNIFNSIASFAESVSRGNAAGAFASALSGLESLVNVIIPSGAEARAREIARLEDEIRKAQELELTSLRNAQDATARRLAVTTERLSAAFERLADSISSNQASVQTLLDTLATGNEKLQGFNFSASNAQLLDFFSNIQKTLGRLPKNFQEILDSFSPLTRFTPEIREFLDRLKALSPTLQQQVIDLINSLLLAGDGIKNFGKNAANAFNSLIDELNLRFDLLNIEDPLKKLELLAKGIKDRFKAIIPTTDAGIRQLIEQGLAALEAGGKTLIDFLKNLDLEELTADQFRDFLQFLNDLANQVKSKVDDLTGKEAEDLTISAVRQITFSQGNKLIDELTTMRIIQTQMLDIMRGTSLRTPNFNNFGIPGNRIIVVNGNDVRQGNAEDLRGINRRQLELAIAASRAQGMN